MKRPKDPLAVRIGECIHIARRRQGLTQERLAELVGVTAHHISRIERGKESPSIHLIHKIATTFGLELNELLIISRI